MSRKLRFTFRNGEVRMGELPPGQTLIQLWNIFKRDGGIIGAAWCAQFDYVAMIEVVEMPAEDTRPGQGGQTLEAEIHRLSTHVGAGAFKPPGEA